MSEENNFNYDTPANLEWSGSQWINCPLWAITELSGPQLKVYLAIATFADRRGACWPKVSSIAKMAGIEVRQAQYILAQLRATGVLQVDARSRANGGQASSLYTLRGNAKNCTGEGGNLCTPFHMNNNQIELVRHGKEKLLPTILPPLTELCRIYNTILKDARAGAGLGVESAAWTAAKARLREGRDPAQFLADAELVIKHKLAEWGKDPKMSKFIRPSTLFSGKFDEYVIEARRSDHKEDFSEYHRLVAEKKAQGRL